MSQMGLQHKLIGLLIALVGIFSTAQAQFLTREVRANLLKPVLTVVPLTKDMNLGDGTGWEPTTPASGYILTNFHVVGDTEPRQRASKAAIFATEFADKPPVLKYVADVVKDDPTYDLAVLKIVNLVDSKSNLQPLPAGMQFAFTPIGDSNALEAGEPLYIIGYPAVSGDTITFTQGLMSGWLGENQVSGGKLWIKTDAKVSNGNSGGAAVNDKGELIGVPTQRTKPIQGVPETQSLLRPISLAWPLIGPLLAGAPASSNTPTTPTTNINPNTQGGWPPNIAVGQSWQLVFKGQSAGTWNVALTEKDKNGDPKGSATSGNQRQIAYMYYDAKNDRIWIDLTTNDSSYTSCAFDSESVKTTTWVGRAYYFKDPNSDGERIGDCTATLRQAQGNQPTQPATAFKWPIAPKTGQTWVFNIQTVGIWTVQLTELDKQGDPKGTGTSSKGEKQTAFFYYEKDKDVVWLDLTPDGKSFTSCRFDAKSISGSTLQGTAYYFKDQNSDGEKLGTCSANLK